MFEFHNISTKSNEYIDTKEKYKQELEKFKGYAQYLTDKAGKANKSSQKSSSYMRSLVRLIIGYEAKFKDNISTLRNFDTYKKLMKITEIEGFKEFNGKTNHFYSATLGCLLSYITYLNSENEEKVDIELNSQNQYSGKSKLISFEDTDLKNVKRKEKRSIQNTYFYPRNFHESLKAKKKSGWVCEFDNSHKTFINESDKMPHVEAHHLIPMAAQGLYENSIDFSGNIISLCPTCHRRIHHSIDEDKKQMLKYFYEKRRNIYKSMDVDISLKELYKMYGILK
ncbi:HNH endonuclease [Mammaliicoccus vitulinus]|uniref:HNH endonuclease n=1 Tax=Mammaliicoccus vitulinus TaxID=71237 RepID=UPI001AACE8F1|nr:HNH endonuclease [Mammaliicoccus vitulinus]MBO3077764.1 HNH endonuclease [Mammaliicoccus vitulinus]